jgi:hypothetical protein
MFKSNFLNSTSVKYSNDIGSQNLVIHWNNLNLLLKKTINSLKNIIIG